MHGIIKLPKVSVTMKVCSEYYSDILLYFETRLVYSDYSSSPPPWFPPTAPANSPHELSPMCHGGSRPYEMSQSVTMYFQSALQCNVFLCNFPWGVAVSATWSWEGCILTEQGRIEVKRSKLCHHSSERRFVCKSWQLFVRVEKCRLATTASRMCLSKLPFSTG